MIRKYINETEFENLDGVLNSNIDYVIVKDNDVDKIVFVTNNINGEDKTYEIGGSEPAPVPLEVLSWSYNDKTKVPSNPIETTLVKPTINENGEGKLLISFKFNQNVDETIVNKDNFVVTYTVDDETTEIADYTLTYPTSNTVLLNMLTDNYCGPSDVTFNSTLLTTIEYDNLLTPIAVSNNEPSSFNDLSNYNYKRPGITTTYEKHNTDELFISFIFDSYWNPIRTNVIYNWTLELYNSDDEPEDIIINPSQIYKIDNFICLKFNMTDIPLGVHQGSIIWDGYVVATPSITIIE